MVLLASVHALSMLTIEAYARSLTVVTDTLHALSLVVNAAACDDDRVLLDVSLDAILLLLMECPLPIDPAMLRKDLPLALLSSRSGYVTWSFDPHC